MSATEQLINQVDGFIRKYYKNKILRGILFFAIIFSISYLIVVSLEYVGRFNSLVRGGLFFTFLLLNAIVLFKNFLVPFAQLFSYGKRINRQQAAEIIGRFFPEVNDKLLNTLQLNDALEQQDGDVDLLKASIRKNAEKLSVVSFSSAVDYKENKRYLKYLLPVFLVFFIIAIFLPSFFKDGTIRLINYSTVFVEPAPFTFELLTKNLKIEEGDAVLLEVKLVPNKGGELPEKVYIESSEGRFLMEKASVSKATYLFPKIKRNTKFNFLANGFRSEEKTIEVISKTALEDVNVLLEFPSYLSIPSQEVKNPNDLMVPEGTKVTWNGRTRNTKSLEVLLGDSVQELNNKGFRFSSLFRDNQTAKFLLKNNQSEKLDTVFFEIGVIKDAYPSIRIEQSVDSLNTQLVILEGLASDDHGISKLEFVTERKSKGRNSTPIVDRRNISGAGGTKFPVYVRLDVEALGLTLEEELSYYFVVYDNDGVNGAKSSKSAVFYYKAPSKKDLAEARDAAKSESMKDLKQLMNESNELKNRMEQFKMDLLKTKNPSWKERQQLEEIKKKQQSFDEKVQSVSEKLQETLDEINKYEEVSDELQEMQEMLQSLLEDLMDDELKDLLEQLEELMDNQKLDGKQELLDNMEKKAEDKKRQMDRTMEMLKRMDVEERIEDIDNKLEELAQEQMQLKEDIENGEISDEEASEKQDEINKEFEKVQKDLDDLMEKNEDLKRPLDLDKMEEDQKDVEKELNDAKDNLDNNNSKKAKDNQEKAADKMREMASKLSAMKSESKQQQQEEDMAALRALLENLIKMSFDQEDNLEMFAETNVNNPNFIQLGREQRSIIDNFRPVEDSLLALADRIPQLSSFVTKELNVINNNFSNIPDDIDERRKRELGIKQQLVMTSLNNLALFFDESLQNMQQQMQGEMSGSGSCDNPGGKGKGSEGDDFQNMKDMLKKQLEEMQKGPNPGGNKPGEGQEIKLPFGNKEAAQMAAQQNAIRKKLEELRKELNKEGKGEGNELNELLKELEEQEKDLVNKKWDGRLIERQKEILTRLLESEKALQERGWDDERESQTGKDKDFGNQIEFLEYKYRKEKQIELLRAVDPNMSKYYRDRANDFINAN